MFEWGFVPKGENNSSHTVHRVVDPWHEAIQELRKKPAFFPVELGEGADRPWPSFFQSWEFTDLSLPGGDSDCAPSGVDARRVGIRVGTHLHCWWSCWSGRSGKGKGVGFFATLLSLFLPLSESLCHCLRQDCPSLKILLEHIWSAAWQMANSSRVAFHRQGPEFLSPSPSFCQGRECSRHWTFPEPSSQLCCGASDTERLGTKVMNTDADQIPVPFRFRLNSPSYSVFCFKWSQEAFFTDLNKALTYLTESRWQHPE